MELKSNFDFKALRKAQSATMRNYNRAGKAVDKLGLSAEDTATIEAVLTRAYDKVMNEIMKNPNGSGATAAAAPVAEGFV